MAKDYAVRLLEVAQENLASATRSLANDNVYGADKAITAAELFLATAIRSLMSGAKPPATGWYV